MKTISLKELFTVMAPLGINTYGGPLAHIAIYKSIFVDKNKWVTETEFTELFSISQSLPGI